YLWPVAAALAVMVAVIASHHLWLLNFLHVVCGLLWTGIDLFMGFMLGPILRVVDITARKAVLLRLTPRTLFLMPTLSIITRTTGWFLADDLRFTAMNYPPIRMGGSIARADCPDEPPGDWLSVAYQLLRLSRIAEGQSR